VRTNNETISAATALAPGADYSTDVSITASIFPDERSHIENNSYGAGGDGNAFLFVPLIDGTARSTAARVAKLLAAYLRHPLTGLRALNPIGWSRRTIVLTTMQTAETSLTLRLRRRRLGRGSVMDTALGAGTPPSSFLPLAQEAARMAATRMGGYAQSSILDLRGVPTTAHFIGGAVIGADPSSGVVDDRLRAFGYENLLICDGSVMPTNPGVNPSLTITALAEHAMSHIPARLTRRRENDVSE